MPSVIIIGAQWGDEGKGKIVDALAERADVVVRFQGGDNAGHTVVHKGRKFVFHIVPSGILHPRTMCVIGGGVVLNLKKLVEELRTVNLPESEWRKRLCISGEAHLILPCHIALDQYNESQRGQLRIGTTLRGIGPAYADRAARTGVRMGDTLDEDYFRGRLKVCLDFKRELLPEKKARVVCDVDRVADEQLALARPFADLIVDTGLLLEQARQKDQQVLFEGAQGTMLDVGSGTYPYVTSSHTIAGGASVGAGVGPHYFDVIAGVTKAYATRVGEGPFPTELDNEIGESLRNIGGEYGATTQRPRRCGWLDIVQLRRAVRLNSLDELIVTKLDVLDSFERIGVCVAYRRDGQRYVEHPCNPSDLDRVKPEYEFLPGWQCSTAKMNTFKELPKEACDFIKAVERWLGVPVTMISTGKDRSHLIVRKSVF